MNYSFWDTRTTNVIAWFDNEPAAMRYVLDGIQRSGPEDTNTLWLEIEDDQGELIQSISGSDLAARARTYFASSRSGSVKVAR